MPSFPGVRSVRLGLEAFEELLEEAGAGEELGGRAGVGEAEAKCPVCRRANWVQRPKCLVAGLDVAQNLSGRPGVARGDSSIPSSSGTATKNTVPLVRTTISSHHHLLMGRPSVRARDAASSSPMKALP
jgi:hypothetical protein